MNEVETNSGASYIVYGLINFCASWLQISVNRSMVRKGTISSIFKLAALWLMLSACNSSEVYVISKEDSLDIVRNTRQKGLVIRPPKFKYAEFTIIIDSLNNTYFYSLPIDHSIKGIYDNGEPEFISLKPNELFKIPPGTEKQIFIANILEKKGCRLPKAVMLASFTDTIHSEVLNVIREMSENDPKKIRLYTRLALSEERKAVKAKIEGRSN